MAIILALTLFPFSDKIVRGGSNEAGSIIAVEEITGEDSGGNDESNVDAFRKDDCDGDVATKDLEPFSDLTATLTISNASRPNFPESTSHPVKIYRYKVTFVKMGTPRQKRKMPDIQPFTANISTIIPAATDPDTPATGDVKITILSKAMKEVFANKYILRFGEDPRNPDVLPRFLSYKVNIKIFGKEIPYNNKVDTSASLFITITEVDNCQTTAK